LKEAMIIDTDWILEAEMTSDIYTNNLPVWTFDKQDKSHRRRRKIYEINYWFENTGEYWETRGWMRNKTWKKYT
jgi:hypothetical protein